MENSVDEVNRESREAAARIRPISVNTVITNQDRNHQRRGGGGVDTTETLPSKQASPPVSVSGVKKWTQDPSSEATPSSQLVSIEDHDYQAISSATITTTTTSTTRNRSPTTALPATAAFLSRNNPSVTDPSRAVSVTSSDESVTDSATEQDSLLRSKKTSTSPSGGNVRRTPSARSSGERLSRNRSRNNNDRRCRCLCCFCYCISDGFSRMGQLLCKKKQFKPRNVPVAGTSSSTPFFHHEKHPSNIIQNQKYNVITFLPVVLFNQFKFFLNLYFLLMAISQFVPDLKVGYLYTYWAPLGFVLTVTLIREAVDDFLRYKRDKSINSQLYQKLTPTTREVIPSSKIKVGDLILVYKDQRVPADMIFLKTTEKNGACFIRTDQLDGETDWKLRLAVSATQQLKSDEEIFAMDAFVYAEEPRRDIHSFTGTFTVNKKDGSQADKLSLSIENTLWANTVVASGTAIGLVVYTGPETRSVMNNLEPRSKVGLLDYEVNDITKVLFAAVVILAFAMICLKGFNGPWYRYWFRFLLLFSYIIPISLRVNLEIGRVVYSYMIQRDIEVPGIVVRTTTIPEDLGRLSYLLTDKTGTLTRNEMVFKRIHLGKVSYSPEYFDEVAVMLKQSYTPVPSGQQQQQQGQAPSHRRQDSSASNISTNSDRRYYMRHTRMDSYEVDRDTLYRVNAAVTAIALCHNVTPSYDNDIEPSTPGAASIGAGDASATDSVVLQMQHRGITYQASSPDEVALVQWTERVGLALVHRDLTSMQLQTPTGATHTYDILQIFPFSSETKRMGIIVRDTKTREILFLLKGADVVMCPTIQYSDWLQEQCDNMARSGLRTLVVARKFLSEEQYQDFESRYHQAKLSIHDRAARMGAVMSTLEKDMELLCLTGVEDRLQEGVPTTLKGLQDAGIKIWMLTGDKLETAISIAKSSQLVKKMQEIYVFRPVKSRTEANLELNNFHRKNDCPLIIRGEDLEVVLKFYSKEFMEIACHCPAVVCCRCSPTQKAEVVRLIQTHTKKRTCAVGDGGNDVSMIQTADVGVGIVGKEGQQASLAADFSILQFSHIYRLILLHGRYSYKRSATLAQFIFHRGLIISTLQAIFSSVFYFASVSLYQGFLMIGYATFYTMFPVFSIVLDKDVSPKLVMRYPELYKLMKGRSLSYKTFFIWVLISIYQGGVIMYGAMLLFLDEFIHVVAITFTAVILTELLMLALTVRTWHWMMLVAELVSLSAYLMTLILRPQDFDEQFIQTFAFLWKVSLLTIVSCLPLWVLKFLHRKISPPSHCKLT